MVLGRLGNVTCVGLTVRIKLPPCQHPSSAFFFFPLGSEQSECNSRGERSSVSGDEGREQIEPKRKSLSQRTKSAAFKRRRPIELLYAIGGLSPKGNVSGVEYYNPLDHEWRILGPVSKHRNGVGVASLHGSIYAVGGHDGVVCLSNVERYEPENNEWKRDVAPLSEPKQDVAVAELGGYLYCVGGYDGLLCVDTVER
nr:PREDICTED: kelch-like protein 20 [Anolis carolinensis]|eukprot:XP_008121937.1 PREDICTED: kelch-like protein 20 [Anolis carolinensis]